MAIGVAKIGHNNVEIAYEAFGALGDPLLLLAGVGVQMLIWHDDFCAALAERGFAVARFDNRDAGLSTHFTALGQRAFIG
jgi:pimeloyl-ACP methyl ester carboxylesterase